MQMHMNLKDHLQKNCMNITRYSTSFKRHRAQTAGQVLPSPPRRWEVLASCRALCDLSSYPHSDY